MTFPRPPQHFTTARTFLRPVTSDDAENIFNGYANSPTATRYMVWPRQTSPAYDGIAARSASCWQSGTAYPWAVILRSTDQFLGVIELRINPPKADFGYIFCEDFWGLGLATEVVKCVVDWALTQPEIFRVWATCHPDNTASARVLAKVGLKLEARLENWEARPQLGELAGPSLLYGKTKPVTGLAGR
jgi:ribosomal-protein-alanine N-acetyltransferase